jgi:DNA-binding response OmpR family regulator
MDTETYLYGEWLANILVIEDLPSWQKKFKRFLQEEPFHVVLAANWMEALYLARVYTFDLLILDINLSGVPYNIDGLQVANELWCGNRDLTIIIVSGDKDWYRRLGFFEFDPRFIFEKQRLDQDDFVKKIYQALNY